MIEGGLQLTMADYRMSAVVVGLVNIYYTLNQFTSRETFSNSAVASSATEQPP
jgi:hypothetical protein